jgi:imidazolonepropionase-like amidohydrolase
VEKILIRAGLLIDGYGKTAVENGAVLIEADRIRAVGRSGEIGPVSGAKEFNYANGTMLPGLIDCHNHLSMNLTYEDWLSRVNDSDAEKTIAAITNMLVDLKSGVTTARCLGEKNFLDIACKKATQSGLLSGPRLLVAGKSIRSTHGHGILAYVFDGPDQVRRGVRENIKAGADVIKILTTATVRGSDEIHSDYTREEIFAAVEEAHRAGLRVAAHCIGGVALQWCLEAGIDSIEHGYFMNQGEIELLAKSESWLVLTPSAFLMEERLKVTPSAEMFRKKQDEAAQCMAAAIKGGVRFAVGSDAIHGCLAKEMEFLVSLGASEMQAIVGATYNGAALCGLDKSVGTLESGKIADMIVVQGNPLEDIRAVQRVIAVVCRGKFTESVDTKDNAFP